MILSPHHPFGKHVTEQIIAHGESNPQEEICGIVHRVGNAWIYKGGVNTARDKRQHFTLNLHQSEPKAASWPHAIIHSHPDGPAYPSLDDMRQQQASGVCWGIYVPRHAADSGLFWFGGAVRYPLMHRPYRHGVTDCYALVRDWAADEWNAALIDRPRGWDWWHHGEDLYTANLHAAGFGAVPKDAPLQRGDIGLARVLSPVVNHALIWLGDGCVLHHPAGRHGYDPVRLPRSEPAERWQKYIDHWVRRTPDAARQTVEE